MSIINSIGSGVASSNNIVVSDAIADLLQGDSGSLQEFIDAIDEKIDYLLSPPSFAAQSNFYVDTANGSDENDGSSASQAFLSVEKLYSEIYRQNIRFGILNLYLQGNINFEFINSIEAEVISFYLGDSNTRFAGSLDVSNQKHIILDQSYLSSESYINARKCDYIGLEELNLIGSARVSLKDSYCVYNRSTGSTPQKTLTDLTGDDSTISIENVHLFSHPNAFVCVGTVSKTASVYSLKNVTFSTINIRNFGNFTSIDLPEIINLNSFQDCKILLDAPISANGFGITAGSGGTIRLPDSAYLTSNRIDPTVDLFDESTGVIDVLASRDRPSTQKLLGLIPSIATNSVNWILGSGSGQICDSQTDPNTPLVRSVSFSSDQTLAKPGLLNGTTKSCFAYYFWNNSAIQLDYQDTHPKSEELIDKLFVAEIFSNNGVDISEVKNLRLGDDPETKALIDLGAVNLESKFPNAIANTMRLSFSTGKFKFAGRGTTPKAPHLVTIAAVAQITYSLYDPNGGLISAGNLDFDFNRYWNGNSVVPPNDPNFTTIQFIYLKYDGTFHVVLGQYEYSSLTWAIASGENAENKRLPDVLNNSDYIYLAAIAGKANTTDISQGNPETGQVVIMPNRGAK